MDLNFLARPHAHRVQLDLFYDYRTNVALYPQWQAFLRAQQLLTGFYFAVLKEGEVAAGDPISLLHRDEHQMPLNL